jgi:glycosyltransferase involved in cell wall biosynthesis
MNFATHRTHEEQMSAGQQGIDGVSLRKDAVDRALLRLRSPYEMQVICIDVTNKCDLACSNCTRLLENQEGFWDMTPENFRIALRSLDGYPGIIAMIGGNPTIHPQFELLCRIFAEEVPNRMQRGLWTNNLFKHSKLSKEVFGIFNLNPHGMERGISSMTEVKDFGWYYEGNSTHSPVLAAVKDLFEEEEMWERISECDVNQNWSATVIQNNGKLRAYFCEVAASFDLARGEDHGVELVDGWWKKNISEFRGQVEKFCPGCGVPAKIKGSLDFEEVDSYTLSNADIAEMSQKKGRTIKKIEEKKDIEFLEYKVTDYSELLRWYSKNNTAQIGNRAKGLHVDRVAGLVPSNEAPQLELPLVSVIITNYNYGPYLKDALASVKTQSYPNIEVIIVDDASTDESVYLLPQIEAHYSDVKVVRKGKNSGQYEAFVTGFSFSSGQFIVFLDADDVLLPSFVSTHVLAHLSSRLPVGFTSGDGMQTVKNSIANGGFIPINEFIINNILKNLKSKAYFRRFDEIVEYSWPGQKAIPADFVERLHLRLDNGWKWAFSNTSGNCFRRDAIKPILNLTRRFETKIQADCFLNKFVALLFGAIIIDMPLFLYRLHGQNGLSNCPEMVGCYFHNIEKCFDGEIIIFKNVVDRLIEEAETWVPKLGFGRYQRALIEMQRDHMVTQDYEPLHQLSHYICQKLSSRADDLIKVIGPEGFNSLLKEILRVRFSDPSLIV